MKISVFKLNSQTQFSNVQLHMESYAIVRLETTLEL